MNGPLPDWYRELDPARVPQPHSGGIFIILIYFCDGFYLLWDDGDICQQRSRVRPGGRTAIMSRTAWTLRPDEEEGGAGRGDLNT